MSQQKVSIIIPCYNEQKYIKAILQKINKVNINKEVIVVDDGSVDGTRAILRKLPRHLVDLVIYHKHNLGKGAALHTGFQAATGDILIPQDADLEYNPMDIIKVTQPIFNNESDAVIGSRFLHTSPKGHIANRIANRFLTWFFNIVSHKKLTDMNACYIAFKRIYLKQLNLKEKDFAFNPEIVGKLTHLNIRLLEVQVEYKPRTAKEGKKIKFKDGIKSIKAILKYGR